MAVTRIDRTRRPAPGAAPAITLPKFNRFKLNNGMAVLAVKHDDIPEVSARVVLKASASEDERERAGVALLVARALTEGANGRSAREVAEWLDHLGARFSLDVDYDGSVLSLHFLTHVFDEAFAFLAEVVAQPTFEAAEVERLREERLDEIASSLDEPRAVADLRLSEAIFGDHRYGMRVGGVERTVRSIDARKLREFHERHYRPSNATLVVVGDLPALDELRERLEAAFERWDGAATGAGDLAEPAVRAGRSLWAVNWPGPQTEVRVGGLGIARSDPDYMAVLVMNSLLGGLFSSRINMNLREDKGWTYGATTRFDARRRRGPYFAATAVDARAGVPAVREILGEMERMKTDAASDEELELAINALTLSLPRNFETAGQVSARVTQQVIYDLPDVYWETYADGIRAVGKEKVRRVAQRLLATESNAIVVVGPVADQMTEFETLGAVELRDVRGHLAEP